jgi:hypothetical protein
MAGVVRSAEPAVAGLHRRLGAAEEILGLIASAIAATAAEAVREQGVARCCGISCRCPGACT